MECRNHPGAEAADRCSSCMEPFCSNCLVTLRVRKFCGSCKVTALGSGMPIVEQATDNYGRIDVLVNVAGGLTAVGPVTESSHDVFEREMAVNVKTMYLASRAAAQVMVRQRSGAIVSFASVAAFSARPTMAAYSAAKAGVAALTQALALELRDHGIRANAVAPGLVRTADNRASMGDAKVRWVEIADVVHAVMFLASDYAAGITGHVLPVSLGEL